MTERGYFLSTTNFLMLEEFFRGDSFSFSENFESVLNEWTLIQKSSQASVMELFAKIANGFYTITISEKSFIILKFNIVLKTSLAYIGISA